MAHRWARRLERYLCGCLTYFPLAFVYGLTTWAVWVVYNIGTHSDKSSWIGKYSRRSEALLDNAILDGRRRTGSPRGMLVKADNYSVQ